MSVVRTLTFTDSFDDHVVITSAPQGDTHVLTVSAGGSLAFQIDASAIDARSLLHEIRGIIEHAMKEGRQALEMRGYNPSTQGGNDTIDALPTS